MENLTIPKLSLTIESQNYENADVINEQINEWIAYYTKVGSKKNYEKQNKAYLSTRVWNYGSYERILAIAKMMAIIIISDDFFDVKDLEWSLRQAKEMLDIAKNNLIIEVNSDCWIQSAFSNAMIDINALAPANWRHRFIESLRIFFKGMQLELKYNQPKLVPTLVEYLSLRPFSFGVEICLNFIELAANKYSFGQNVMFNRINLSH